MEDKYQMFFPCSSSSSTMAAANFSSSANHANNNSFFDHQGGRDQSSNGGLQGLLRSVTDDQNQFGGETSSTSAQNDQYNPPPSSSDMAAAAGHGKTSVVKAGEKKMRKPKHAFQTRSQVDILDDGYRWRKYGQKAVKNNKFPRSYYRCTYQGCNVKKQVQRLTKDEGVVVTTYEGMHTHPIEKPSDNFDHILSQMQIYTPF